MQGNAKSIYSVFTENSRFIVPIYQRLYSWRIEQCRQLWNDIIACATNKRDKHFFGSTVRVPDAAGMIVIDGQQRITTISLLMLAIRNALISEKRTATRGGSTKDWILNEFLLERCYPPRMSALKLLLTHGDALAYSALLSENQKTPNSNICRNYSFFEDCIANMEISVDELLAGIEKLCVIDISIDKSDNPQLVFESINSTGLDLTEGDKIRNFILMGLSNEEQQDFYKKYWQEIEELTRREDNVDGIGLFVRDVMTAIRFEIPGLKVIYPEFKRFCSDWGMENKGVESMLCLLLEYAKNYFLLLHPERIPEKNLSFLMGCINRQECLPAYPYLVEIFKIWSNGDLADEQLAACLRIIDAFVFRRLICDLPTNSLNKIFTDLHKAIVKIQEDDSDHVIPYEERLAFVLKSRTGKARFPNDEEFRTCMIERHVYELRTKNRAYLFSRLEHGISKSAPVYGTNDPIFQKISVKDYSIEHIMPQTLNASWRKELGPKADEIHGVWLHRLGNLTLTAYNSEMGNATFKSKMGRSLQELKNDNFGFSSEAHHLFLTEYISQQEKWTEKEMEERAGLLADRALKIWEFPKTTYKPPVPLRFVYSLSEHKPSFFTNTKPIAFSFNGDEYPANTWTSITQSILNLLREKSVELLRKGAEASTTIRLSTTEQIPIGSDKIADGIFAYTHGSVWENCNVLKQAMAYFDDVDVQFIFSSEIEADDE